MHIDRYEVLGKYRVGLAMVDARPTKNNRSWRYAVDLVSRFGQIDARASLFT